LSLICLLSLCRQIEHPIDHVVSVFCGRLFFGASLGLSSGRCFAAG
jgi:hypothetical protein